MNLIKGGARMGTSQAHAKKREFYPYITVREFCESLKKKKSNQISVVRIRGFIDGDNINEDGFVLFENRNLRGQFIWVKIEDHRGLLLNFLKSFLSQNRREVFISCVLRGSIPLIQSLGEVLIFPENDHLQQVHPEH